MAWLLLVVALAVAGGCRSGSDSSSTTSSTLPREIRVTAASVAVESMRPEPVEFPNQVRDSVVATLNTWIDVGVVDPLLTGQPPVGLDAAFSPVALARLSLGSPDRAALLEEGTSAAVQPEKATASLLALADESGNIGLVTAFIEVAFVKVTEVDQVRVVRTGEVVVVPFDGQWLIDSYDVVTKRDTVVATPDTTTTTAGERG